MKILEGVELDPKEFRERAGITRRFPTLTEAAVSSDYMKKLADEIRRRLGPGWTQDTRTDPTFHYNEYYFVIKPSGTDSVFLITQVGNYQTFPADEVNRTSVNILRKVSTDIPLRDETWNDS
jgi:hypothetical protein